MSNLDLWHKVEKTDPKHVKTITGKSYSGTSPKPHWLVMKATETFGPCGIGWGFTIDERIEDGAMIAPGFYNRMHIAKVKVWYLWGDKRGEVEHIGGTEFSGQRASGKPFTDEDAAKKSVTDALVKALSMIGFAGDIFMGRYDDSKYVQSLRDEAQEAAPAPIHQKPALVFSAAAPDGVNSDLWATAYSRAESGTAAFTAWAQNDATTSEKAMIGPFKADLWAMAKAADAKAQEAA